MAGCCGSSTRPAARLVPRTAPARGLAPRGPLGRRWTAAGGPAAPAAPGKPCCAECGTHGGSCGAKKPAGRPYRAAGDVSARPMFVRGRHAVAGRHHLHLAGRHHDPDHRGLDGPRGLRRLARLRRRALLHHRARLLGRLGLLGRAPGPRRRRRHRDGWAGEHRAVQRRQRSLVRRRDVRALTRTARSDLFVLNDAGGGPLTLAECDAQAGALNADATTCTLPDGTVRPMSNPSRTATGTRTGAPVTVAQCNAANGGSTPDGMGCLDEDGTFRSVRHPERGRARRHRGPARSVHLERAQRPRPPGVDQRQRARPAPVRRGGGRSVGRRLRGARALHERADHDRPHRPAGDAARPPTRA